MPGARVHALIGAAAAVVAATVATVAAAVVVAGPVGAACHAFTVEADPSSVTEGAEVTVTVRRDAAVGPSQVDVETVDGTATGGSDYEPVQRTISFTNDTEQSFPVPTLPDGEPEDDETFLLRLSNPDGCAVNPNFQLGPDAEVTVVDDDAPATTAPAPTAAPRTTAAPTTGATGDPGGSTTTADQPDDRDARDEAPDADDASRDRDDGQAPTATDDDDAGATTTTAEGTTTVLEGAARASDGGGTPVGAVVAAVVGLVLAVAAAGTWFLRGRPTAG